ncbi:hypothetical protein NDU88_012405 [Pleurodeles waltl]|uniref:LRRCT domain-containing protein n=1 Tax=Pleurodeles waltl TaxID=8319 RepID=A0AAV7R1C6_PLEWA|nr:hypothetical protein NDU88_012405 [Pleurodeles waltl]
MQNSGEVYLDGVTMIKILPGLSNSTEAIILLKGGLNAIPPEAFQNFSKLRWLYINGCLVSSLENRTFVTGEGNSLQELDLNNNRLQSCTVDILAFAGLARLEKLILTNNALDALKASWFMDMKFLTKLNMSANMINYIPPRTFETLSALDHLDLADNRIQYLHTETFFGLDSLTELNVSRNLILFIDEDTFEPLKALQVLRLVGNRLVTLKALPELVGYVYLHQNPWECSCKFFNLVVSLKEKIVDVSSVLCDMPTYLKGEQVVLVGPDICINATMPPGYLQQEGLTSYAPLYSFLGGFLCALIICLIIYFISKHSKQSRTPKPGDQRSNKIHSSLTGAVQENPMKVEVTPELSKCCLSSEVKQPLPNVLQTKFVEQTQCHLSWHPSDGVRKHINAVSLVDSPKMVPAVRTPNKRTMESRKDNVEAIQETVGSNLGGNHFLDTVLNSMSESSTRTEGLTKSLTAPDLLFASQEQQRLNPLKIVHSIEDCTGRLHLKSEDRQSCITQNVKSSIYDPQSYNVQGLKPTLGEPKSFKQQGLQPTLLEPVLCSVQGSESTQEDRKFLSAQHLQPTCDDTNCYSTHVVQPMHDDPKPHNSQDLHPTIEDPESYNQPDMQPILNGPKVYSTQDQHTHDDSNIFSQLSPHDPKCYVGQGLQLSGEEETFNTTHDLRSSHNNPKYYSEPNLQPNPKDSKCYIQPDFFSPYAQPKCYNAKGLYQTQNNEKYCTQDALSITVDAKCLKTLNSCPITEGLQVAVVLPSDERLDGLQLPNLLPKTDQLHTKRDQDLPAEFFQHENSNQTADMKNMESGLMKYFETHHAEEGTELVMESEALPLNSDSLESSNTMKVQNNTNNNGGQKSLSKKCKTWSTFYNIPSNSAVKQPGMKEPEDGIEDPLSSSKRKEEFDREIHRNNDQSEDSEATPQSGRSTELTDFIEASDPLQDGRSTEQTESARNGTFSELPDVLLNGRSTELSEDSISQRDLISFLSSRHSLTSDSGDEDYDEPDLEELNGNERNLNGKHLSKSTIDSLDKTETIDDESNLQNDKDRTSLKSMSVGHCAGKDHKYHRDLFSAGQSQSERDRQCENRHKKHRAGWSLTSDTLSRERFWKYHTNCCNKNKPCPTAKKVLRHLKPVCGESLHHESVRMTKEQFWTYHTYCCAVDTPCPTAKKVLKHLKNEHSESSFHGYDRLTSKRFWKYHRNCCDDSKPCPTAKKVMQRLKIVASQPADALATQSPPSDTDLLEGNDRLSGNLLVRLSQRKERKVISPWK